MNSEKEYIIYKIYCKDANIKDCYVGSTGNFGNRKRIHKFHCNNNRSEKYNCHLYVFIRNNGGWNNFIVEKLCSCEAINRFVLEREYYDALGATLNKNVPSRSRVEYLRDNKERLDRVLREKHTCECGGKYTHHNINAHMKSGKHLNYLLKQINDKLDNLQMQTINIHNVENINMTH